MTFNLRRFKLRIFTLIGLALIANGGGYSPAAAQTADPSGYPNRPIKIIVPVAPGGTVDIVARAIAESLTKSLGQQVIVENKPGASSLLGTNLVAKAAPDGYTLLAHSTTFVTAPVLLKNAGYDPLKDFAPITVTCQIPMVLVVNPDKIAARSLKDFIALARAQPKFYAYASSGNGSTGHIAAELFSRAADVSYLHVPYKGNVPTLDEAGLTGFEDSTFNGLFAPAATPPAIINRLHRELTNILRSPQLVKQFLEKGVELGASATPEQFGQYLAAQTRRYQELARTANISAD